MPDNSVADAWNTALGGADPQADAWSVALSGTRTPRRQAQQPVDDSPSAMRHAQTGAYPNPMDLLRGVGHLSGQLANAGSDVISGLINAVQSTDGQRNLESIVAGRPVAYHPTLESASTDLDDRALSNAASMAQSVPDLPGVLNPLAWMRSLAPSHHPELQQAGDTIAKMPFAFAGAAGAAVSHGEEWLNNLKRMAMETVTDPATYLSLGGKPLAEGGLRLAQGGLQALGGAEHAAAATDALSGLRGAIAAHPVVAAVNKPMQMARDFLGVDTPTKRFHGDDENAIFSQIENMRGNLRDLEQSQHATLLESLRPQIELALAQHRSAVNDMLKQAAASGIPRAQVPLPDMNFTGALQPVRDLLDRDAWLNGTQAVREKMTGLGYKPSAEIADAPLLNIQTDYRQGYVPMKELMDPARFKEFQTAYDATLGLRQRNPLGFNLAQLSDDASTPLTDRVMLRLNQGRDVRTLVQTRRDILDRFGSLNRPIDAGQNLTYLNAVRDRLGPESAGAIDRDIALLNEANAAHFAALKSNTLLPGVDLVKAEDPFLGHAEHNPFNTGGPLADSPDAIGLGNDWAREQREFPMTPALAQRLYGVDHLSELARRYSFLQPLADLKREMLFTLPVGHMKNIAALQLEGPGGVDALTRGLQYGAEGVDDRAAALAQRGAVGLYGHDAPQSWLLNALPPLRDFWRASNKELGTFDVNQRYALHENLLQNDPAYAASDALAQGARLNDILFDYNHTSPFARALRAAGSAFPSWRLGNVTLQARRAGEDPGKLYQLARLQGGLERSVDPDPNDQTAWSPRLNTPGEEALKLGMGDPNWLKSTLGPLAGAYDLIAQGPTGLTRTDNWRKFGEDVLGSGLPAGSSLEDILNISPFSSHAPALFKAFGDVAGVSARNNENAKTASVNKIMGDDTSISKAWAQAYARGSRHKRGF